MSKMWRIVCCFKYKQNVIIFVVVIFQLFIRCVQTSQNFVLEMYNDSMSENPSLSAEYFTNRIKNETRPNIILILADDLGWSDIGPNWPHTSLTPNINAIAKKGIRLTDFHSAASVCAPSRGALLTGRLGLRTGIVRNFANDAVGGIPKNETTLASTLKDAGYRTAMLGKWHLGIKAPHHPMDKGFQKYMGVPYSIDMGCSDQPGTNLPACPACPSGNSNIKEETDCYSRGCDEGLAIPLYVNRTIKHQPVKLHEISKLYANFANDFISESPDPFFLYAAFSHIHVPLAHGPKFENITGKGIFADTLLEMDWLIGDIVAASVKHNENSLIWFLSDNGPWEVKCDLAGSCGPFVGSWQRDLQHGGGGSASKQTVWECGHRVPSLVMWPGYIKPGTSSDALVSALDVFPTISAICNVPLPSDRIFDGIDVQGLLRGQSNVGHEVLFHPNSGAAGPNGEIGAVRINGYKVIYYSGGSAACGGQTGPVQSHILSPLVFNIITDPGEAHSLNKQSAEWYYVVHRAEVALAELKYSVKCDNTSTVDYSKQWDARPCCNSHSSVCRCPWD